MMNSQRSEAYENVIKFRKFRKMGEIMAVVNKDDYVLFGVDTCGRFYRVSPPSHRFLSVQIRDTAKKIKRR